MGYTLYVCITNQDCAHDNSFIHINKMLHKNFLNENEMKRKKAKISSVNATLFIWKYLFVDSCCKNTRLITKSKTCLHSNPTINLDIHFRSLFWPFLSHIISNRRLFHSCACCVMLLQPVVTEYTHVVDNINKQVYISTRLCWWQKCGLLWKKVGCFSMAVLDYTFGAVLSQ